MNSGVRRHRGAHAVVAGAAALALPSSFAVGAVMSAASAGVAVARPDWVQSYSGLIAGLPLFVVVWLWRFWRAR